MSAVDVDLLVAGAGPVGLGTALLAARAGLSVAVVEPRADPVDKACGEGLMPGAAALLAGLGVQLSGRPFHGICYLDGTGRSARARFRSGCGLGVRRTGLHGALADAADAAGVQRVAGRVEEIRQSAGRVEAAGLTARYLAAADGLHSSVSRRLGLDEPSRLRARFGLRQHFAVRPWSDLVEVHWADGAEAYVTPVGDELVGVAVLTARRGLGFADWLPAFPLLQARLAGAEPATRVRAAGPLARTVRRRVEGRVLLVGDAAGYVDALTGEGIAVGLAGARALVAAVVADRPAGYERAWRRSSRRYRLLTRGVLLASSQPRLRAAVVPAAEAMPGAFRRLVDALA